jgi:eukaryotic-like serine/threonine-protein kinase
VTNAGQNLDDAVEQHAAAFENERAANKDVVLRDFLPDRTHAEFLVILQELVRVDMEYRARCGERVSVEDYRSDLPELFETPAGIGSVVFEEYRLLLQAGIPADRIRFAERYDIDTSDWPSFVAEDGGSGSRAVRCGATTAPSLLDDGTQLLDFEIVGALGQGAFSRVYLARQKSLADRCVVLKFSTLQMCEADRLARLQHTNIVPVYSVHRYQQQAVLCMPYFGCCTIQDLLSSSPPDSGVQSGSQLISTVATLQEETVTSLSVTRIVPRFEGAANSAGRDPARQSLQALDHEGASLWIAKQLADGIAHAHARGILHRDMKPANVLLTEDGLPMILDFNLSDQLIDGKPQQRGFVGGTLPYMSPEQIRSLEDLSATDGRSDIYSIGVILFEMLTGRLPFSAVETDPTELLKARCDNFSRVWDKPFQVCADTRSILMKCLEPEPKSRYQSAADLATDIERQLHDLPLVHAPNRSLSERSKKWIRRHPLVTSGSAISIVSAVVLMSVSFAWWRVSHNLGVAKAEATFETFRQRMPHVRSRAFAAYFRDDDQDAAAREISSLLNVYASNSNQPAISAPQLTLLNPELQQEARNAVGELQYLLYEIRNIGSGSGNTDDKIDLPPEVDLPDYQAALDLFLNRHYSDAEVLLQAISDRTPDNFGSAFLHGLTLRATGKPKQAWAAFSVCIALEPNNVQAWYQRGLCHLENQAFVAATGDFSNALAIDPEFTQALVSRGIAFRRYGKQNDALDDISAALRQGYSETRLYFIRSEIQRELGNIEAADKDRKTGLSLIPADSRSWVVRGLQQLPSDPESALADLLQARRLDLHSHDVYRNISMVLSEYLQRPDDAIAELDAAIGIYPHDPYLWGGRAVLHARDGRRDEAVADAERAVVVSDEPMIKYQAACVFALCSPTHKDDADEAIRLLGKALREDSSLVRLATTDPDLDSVRDSREFKNVLAASMILDAPVRKK